MNIEIITYASAFVCVAVILCFLSAFAIRRADAARNRHAERISAAVRLNATVEYLNPDNGLKTSGYIVYISRFSQFVNVRNCRTHAIHALDFHEIKKIVEPTNAAK